MGPADSAKPGEDAGLQMAAGNPSPPPDSKSPSPPSKSPSPGSASGTTQSASPGDQNPLEPPEAPRNPGASPSKPADPNRRQDLADASNNGSAVESLKNSQQPFAVNDVPDHSSTFLEQGSLACSAGHGSGQGLSSGGPAPCVKEALLPASTQMQKGLSNLNASGGIPDGFGNCGQQCLPPVQPTIKVEFEGDPAQQVQHVNKAFVKSEQAEPSEEEAEHHRQGHWQTAPRQGAQHAQHARRPPDFSGPNSTAVYAYPSQTPTHAQRLSAADAEAQLFFMPHASVPLPAAAMMAPKPNGFVAHPSDAFALPQHTSSIQHQHLRAQQQQQQHFHRQQQQQQLQWLAQQHYHRQTLMHQRQQQQSPMGLSEQHFQALTPGQTLRIVHSQKHRPVPGVAPAHHAQHAMHAPASQPPPSAFHNSNGLPSSARHSSGSQHAKHGANGFSSHQQCASGMAPHQKAQHAKHGANGLSNPSVHSGDPQCRSSSGSSTAFIIWCDGQYKARGQAEKRAALRNFVHAAKVGLPAPLYKGFSLMPS